LVFVSTIPSFFLTCLAACERLHKVGTAMSSYLAAITKSMASRTFLDGRSWWNIQPCAIGYTFGPNEAIGTRVVQVLCIEGTQERSLQC
jgi:hypothetical protein